MASYERIAVDTADVADGPGNALNVSDSIMHPRAAFRRQSSSFGLAQPDRKDVFRQPSPSANSEPGQTGKEGGLGISYVPGSPERMRRVPVGSKETLNSTYSTPEIPSGRTSQATTYHNTPNGGSQAYIESPDTQMLRGPPGSTGVFACPTHKDILDPKVTWLSISIIGLAIFSTTFSGVYLGIAFWKPRWGQRIGTNGHVSFATASLLSALFAKMIELSFVTVFITFLGQALSRRAFRKSTTVGGISIAETTMRTWVMQPGTLITHAKAVRYSAMTFLGGITLLAAFAGVFYTTAAEALVAPKLKDGPLHTGTLQGMVAMSFANSIYLENNCQTPIPRTAVDPDFEGTTCLQIEHAGQGWHNFKSYIDNWVDSNNVGNSSNTTSYSGRPPPIAMLYDNTTVQGQWINKWSPNPTGPSQYHQRIVQNLTMAMPHANVFNAARDPTNGILQPDDLHGDGEYTITASVPAPATVVTCVGMTAAELTPLVYTAWPNASDPTTNNNLDILNWPTFLKGPILAELKESPNRTVVDDLFGFNQNVSGPHIQIAPVFPLLPQDYNTVVSFWQDYGQLSVYVLAKPTVLPYPTTDEYVLCSVKAILYNDCSTQYHVEQSGGHMSVYCDDDPQNTLSYMQSQPPALSIDEPDWRDIATEWMNSLSLGQGIANGNASGARLLTQMIPPDNHGSMALLENMPSIGEALSVLAACTLLLSSSKSPFIHYWKYSENALLDPQPEIFNASIITRDYTSGGTQQWQGIFYIILLAVFVMNLLCLICLLRYYWRDGQVTDFTEPQNLFSLAINSPASQTMAGSCGGGPEGNMFGKRWQVGMQKEEGSAIGSHPHFYVRFPDDEWAQNSPVVDRRKKRSSVRRMEGFEMDESPAVEQYMRLSGKWGSIL